MTLLKVFQDAFNLILGLDENLVEIVFLSLRVSGSAILLAAAVGLSITTLLELYRFPGRGIIITIFNTLTGLPPVVVGLGLYMFLSRSGPFGFMDLLYSPVAMIIAQTILAVPIVVAVSHAAASTAGPAVRLTAMCLGATRLQSVTAVIKDARYSIMASVATAFGRVLGEVGAVLIVGGNIAHYTRVMTTAIALEADRGDFELAIALGLVLIFSSFIINSFFYLLQRKGVKR